MLLILKVPQGVSTARWSAAQTLQPAAYTLPTLWRANQGPAGPLQTGKRRQTWKRRRITRSIHDSRISRVSCTFLRRKGACAQKLKRQPVREWTWTGGLGMSSSEFCVG